MQLKVIKYVGLYTEPAKNYNNLVKPDVTWAKKMPFKDSSYACAIATKALEHVPEPKFFRLKDLGYLNRIKCFFTVQFLRPLHKPPHNGFRYTPFAMEQLLLNGESSDISIYALGGWNVSLGQVNDLWLKGSPLFTKQKYITVHYFTLKRTL